MTQPVLRVFSYLPNPRVHLLREAGLPLVTEDEPIRHPRAFEHLFRLAETPAFAKHLGGYLDDARSDLAR